MPPRVQALRNLAFDLSLRSGVEWLQISLSLFQSAKVLSLSRQRRGSHRVSRAEGLLMAYAFETIVKACIVANEAGNQTTRNRRLPRYLESH